MASPIFLVIFSATVYQEVTILLTRWMETVTYSHMFYTIFQFCKFKSLDGNIATAIYERNQLNLYVGVCVNKNNPM